MEKEKDERRKPLADFLRSRRARLSPADVNLPNGGGRRTPGLRREEVAQLAGVGVDWYTWLEQGRDINASEQVLSSVARVLRLDAAETRYLFTLVNSNQVFDAGETVSDALVSMLDNLDTTPGTILNRCWDFLAWNRAFCALYGDVASFPPEERNCLWFVFSSRLLRQMLVDWEGHMQDTVAQFRADYGSNASDPRFADLIRRLTEVSPEFSTWWSHHDVRNRYNKRKEFNHPQAG